MVTPNHNYIETPDGDILPSYAAGHGNQPYYPHVDTEQPDFFHTEVSEGIQELDSAHAEAIARGITQAEVFMNNPDGHGFNWPTAQIIKGDVFEAPDQPDQRTGYKDGRDLSRIDTEEWQPVPSSEKERQDSINHAGAAAVREFAKGK